jgi:hypothetical protein
MEPYLHEDDLIKTAVNITLLRSRSFSFMELTDIGVKQLTIPQL